MNDASGGRLQVGEAVARGLPLVRHAKVRRQESLDLGGRPGLLARCVGLRLPGHRRALEVRGREGDLVQTQGQLCGQLQGCAVRLGAGLEDARLAHVGKVLRPPGERAAGLRLGQQRWLLPGRGRLPGWLRWLPRWSY